VVKIASTPLPHSCKLSVMEALAVVIQTSPTFSSRKTSKGVNCGIAHCQIGSHGSGRYIHGADDTKDVYKSQIHRTGVAKVLVFSSTGFKPVLIRNS